MVQATLLYEHYHKLSQSVGEAFLFEIRWRSLPEGAKPLRLVWNCTDISPESAWCYLQMLLAPETVMLLLPSTLERFNGSVPLPAACLPYKTIKWRLISKNLSGLNGAIAEE
ncbi:hypothetical protein IFO70_07525 [Phormidium tenue FACHB-886]|nr:hypothetical protein [Phormidium tenue FACHB-886]